MARWIYSRHSSRDMAERALANFYAIGEISEGEHPLIEQRGWHWCITLPINE